MSNKTYIGKIVSFNHGFYQVEAQDAVVERHLRDHNLRPWQVANGLTVGSIGTLAYRTTFNSGLWYLDKEQRNADNTI